MKAMLWGKEGKQETRAGLSSHFKTKKNKTKPVVGGGPSKSDLSLTACSAPISKTFWCYALDVFVNQYPWLRQLK